MKIEKMIKKIQTLVSKNLVLILGGLALLYAICNYSSVKGMILDRNAVESTDGSAQNASDNIMMPGSGNVQPNETLEERRYGEANGLSTSVRGLPANCSRQQVADPSELLPKDVNSQFAKLNPSGTGDLAENNTLLNPTAQQGINTVSSSMRNPNMQLRADPVVPNSSVGPWNNTTIGADPHPIGIRVTGNLSQ